MPATPRTPLELAADGGRPRVLELSRAGRRVAWLTFAPLAEQGPSLPNVWARVMPSDPVAYAASLYEVLHVCDEAGVECIVVALPPEAPEWLAVRDRLRRAAAP